MADSDAGKATDSLANIPENISISYLNNSDNLSKKVLQKGLNYYTQGYIHDVKIAEGSGEIGVTERCWASMRKSQQPHKLHLFFIKDDRVSDSHCSCTVGINGQCSHIVGLIKTLQGLKLHNYTHVPDQQSCTSVPQQWHVPRGSKITPVPLNHVVVARPTLTRKRKPILCQIDRNYKLPHITNQEIEALANLKGTPLASRMSTTIPNVTTPLGEVQIGSILSYQTRNLKEASPSIHSCGDTSVVRAAPVKLPEHFKVLNASKCANPEQLERITRDQSQSSTWHRERGTRVTASNFGKILTRKAKPTQSFMDTIFSKRQIHAPSLEYGQRHENTAKAKYLEKYPSKHFHECGFVVNNEFSFLGATPDAKICDQGSSGIVEIKCPFSARNMNISAACDAVKNFCLNKEVDSISLSRNHTYYSQIQGQLLVTGCDFCEFIVFTQKDLFVQGILPDKEHMTMMLTTLSEFYRDFALPYLRDSMLAC